MSAPDPGAERDPNVLLRSLEPLSHELTDTYLEHHGILPLAVQQDELLVAGRVCGLRRARPATARTVQG